MIFRRLCLSCTDSGGRRVLIVFGWWWLDHWTRVCDKKLYRPPTGQMQCELTTTLQRLKRVQ